MKGIWAICLDFAGLGSSENQEEGGTRLKIQEDPRGVHRSLRMAELLVEWLLQVGTCWYEGWRKGIPEAQK